jgi:hypothetical protein
MTEEQLHKIGSVSAFLVHTHLFGGEDKGADKDVVEAKIMGLLSPLAKREPMELLEFALIGLAQSPNPRHRELGQRLEIVLRHTKV